MDTPPIGVRDSRIWINNIARNADLIAIVADLSSQPVEQVEAVIQELDNMGIVPDEGTPDINIGKRQRKMLIIGNKTDLQSSSNNIELNRHYSARFPVFTISAREGTNLDELKRGIFTALAIIRVHTKNPGKPVDLSDPMIMKKGSTLKDAAEAVHKDFRSKLKYALVWGSGKFDGQRAGQEHKGLRR